MKMGMKTKRRWNAVVFHVIVGGIAIFMGSIPKFV